MPAGEPDAERLSGYIGVRRRPGRDERGGQQRGSPDGGAGGPGLSQAGARHFNGRMEVLHLLRLSGLSSIIRCRDGRASQRNSLLVPEEGKKRKEARVEGKKMYENLKKKKRTPSPPPQQKTTSFYFELSINCQPRKPTNICIPNTRPLSSQTRTFPWSFIPKPISQLLRNLDDLNVLVGRRALVQYVDLFFFFFLLGKKKELIFCQQT